MHTQLLLGGGLALLPAALLHAQSDTLPDSTREAGRRLGKFFEVSQKLLQPLPVNTQLDRRVAARLLAALNSEFPSFPQQLDLMPDDPGPAERHSPVAQLIVSAWYLGSVGKTLVTFERALMYRLTADVLPVPSYCYGKPGDWAAAPHANFGES
ncbi:sorbitol dehydrogenase family protein [Microbulbifer sp. CAU 1566]|uniref:sugar dehydrogenase complex small subunit n=1 Tax=unclassified Microbulbifer TaxID=2619833 RepID=UPI00135A5C4F|nr:sugar dehydrogenase complex small subunit [Microbulbifer sp. ALW1]MCK7598020.1 sorbitol dehydrogenase family protein [Microbulbifer sp. CAU 1566]